MRAENINNEIKSVIIFQTKMLREYAKRNCVTAYFIIAAILYPFVIAISLSSMNVKSYIDGNHMVNTLITFLIIPVLIVVLGVIITKCYDYKLKKYVMAAEDCEYVLIPGKIIGKEMIKGSRGTNLIHHMIVSTPSTSEVTVRIRECDYGYLNMGKLAYLIEWNDMDKGILDRYDVYIP